MFSGRIESKALGKIKNCKSRESFAKSTGFKYKSFEYFKYCSPKPPQKAQFWRARILKTTVVKWVYKDSFDHNLFTK